ncbi:MAG TPA: penicillin-binding transpeptidase domain-containing protein, partial [Ruminococcus sp.]|nr:penicillin-binding transpeptidase domain-containing protein [Ruminococcus sp.]
TSTAQTGRFDENGEELCNAWITGFFPAYSPRYVLTVLVEDGGYGNDSAAPIFRRIAERISGL